MSVSGGADGGAEGDLTARDAIAAWLVALEAAIDGGDAGAVVALFDARECFWRDMVAFSSTIATFEGAREIGALAVSVAERGGPCRFRIDGAARTVEDFNEALIRFETPVVRGRGVVRLKVDSGRCWTLFTSITELKGHEEKAGVRRDLGTDHGVHRERRSWLERREAHAAALGRTLQPYVVIVGGGQGGIALGARLTRLGVPYVIVESNARAGDGWRKRYKSLCLHDPVWYDHLPYIPFPDHWPVFTPKDKLGDWLEAYVKVMEVDYWGSATCRSARYDEAAGTWTVEVERAGEAITLRPKHLVLATGMSGWPEVPDVPGKDLFGGQQMHSSAFTSGADHRRKRAVVVGSNNSAHDIAADLYENGADVTMIQRSPTTVVRSETLAAVAWSPLYSEEAVASGITTDIADLRNLSWPIRLLERRAAKLYREVAARDAEFYAALTHAGFLNDFGADGTGIHVKYIRRGSGYYIDVGASALVADGRIKLKSPVEVARLTETGVVLSDGSTLDADLVVFATGYGPMDDWAAALISPEVAARVGRVWGYGSQAARDPGPWVGELRNMWVETTQPGLWFQGGNLFQARFFSLILALQLKARMEGIALPVTRPPR